MSRVFFATPAACLAPGGTHDPATRLPDPYHRGAQARLSLEWREWMTNRLMGQYFRDRSFYQLQAGQLVDNPAPRLASHVM